MEGYNRWMRLAGSTLGTGSTLEKTEGTNSRSKIFWLDAFLIPEAEWEIGVNHKRCHTESRRGKRTQYDAL